MISYHWIDALIVQIVGRGTVVLDQFAIHHVVAFTDAVNLLVDHGSVVVPLLTGTSHAVTHTGWMPCTDASNLP